MPAIVLHDKNQIETFLRQNIYRHLYGLGDLDDFFWNYTTWYAWQEAGNIRAISLLYTGTELPVLLANGDEETDPSGSTSLQKLLRAILPYLPHRFYSHLDPGLEPILAEHYQLDPHGAHDKMGLIDPGRLAEVDISATVSLSGADLSEIEALYRRSYPGNWFDARMLETGHYFGLRHEGRLVSIAGVHVYSPCYRVAALGNITTDPTYRGHGFGRAVTARLCRSLLESVDHIGLNVKADNQAAIRLYRQLGFERVAGYGEYMITLKNSGA